MPPISPEETPVAPKRAQPPRIGPFEPLKLPVFRMLWSTWLVANICMWMNDVAAAWMMTSLTTSPMWVALVQSASTLPVFLLGLPSGALADILDRRRWLVATQFWLAGAAIVLCTAVVLDLMSAPLLLALTFANGIGLALRWPVFSAIVPELVPRTHLPAALGLNGLAMNASRIVGPLLAGTLIASAGTVWVFGLNAVLCVVSGFIVLRWRREHKPNPLGRERLISAMRVGVQFVRQSQRMRAVLTRISIFFLHSTALLALLPLLARNLRGGGAGTFTLLLAAMGAGAIVAVMFLPRLRQALARDQLVIRGTLLQSAATAVMAVAPSAWIAVPAMVVGGMAWITVANSLSVSAQLALPDWVRARGMSIYQMAIMGASAFGAAIWGQVAELSSLSITLSIAAVSGTAFMLLALRYVTDGVGEDDDTTPARKGWVKGPPAEAPDEDGRVVVTVEYLIDPARAAAFHVVMQQTRRTRLSQGAIGWELLHDIAEPGRYIEEVVDESWTEHLRRFHRATAADMALRDRRLAFHQGETLPVVTRYVVRR
ncbi:arabinose ABC transporter permease [Variovorax sp. WS11]|uniref:MFS transporter n=1 Tax=Variovorax sp. WS11 TaxID=1105204 RepID=UPI000D0CE563|nr:MFS transporter [Variovorax sp. WS11]NDZ13356.1 MFS transporter [Variovorax sp. WS11]PSL81636.1 arabinose ABC transporter permease [Variovorax sp. WS11]